MLVVTSIAGGGGGGRGAAADLDRIRMSRAELEKSRIRKATEGGADVAVSLPHGTVMRDGDVLDAGGDRRIVVEQVPEKVATARPREGGGGAAAFLVGHIVGNRHRPISVSPDGTAISFPIQADSEIGLFERLFERVGGGVDLRVSEAVFRPHGGADVHGH